MRAYAQTRQSLRCSTYHRAGSYNVRTLISVFFFSILHIPLRLNKNLDSLETKFERIYPNYSDIERNSMTYIH